MQKEIGGGRKKLRQKMISFMYLIFIVLAFIYIPADFIDSTRDINNSIDASTQEIQRNRDLKIEILKARLKDSTNRVKVLNYSAVIKLTDSTSKIIDELKNKLLKASGGYDNHGYLKGAKENKFSEKLLIKENVGHKLRALLLSYKTKLKERSDFIGDVDIDAIIQTDDSILTSSGKPKEWEHFYFDKMPLALTIATLSKFQNDLRRVEDLTIGAYVKTITDDYNIVLESKFKKADEIFSFPENKNTSTITKREEDKEVDLIPRIEKEELSQIYIGINNPIKASHPKVEVKEITATISNGEIIKKDNLFYARVNKPGIVEIATYAENATDQPDGILTTQKFLVVNLPDPTAYMGDRKDGNISSKIFRIQKNIEVRSELINNADSYTVKHFSVKRITRAATIIKSENNAGAFFNALTREVIDQGQSGDIYIFDNIIVVGADGDIKSVSPIVLNVI